jgi:hypothetical protein
MSAFAYGFVGFILTLAPIVGWGIRRSEDGWTFVGEYLIPALFFGCIVAVICGLIATGFVDGW